MKAKREHRVPLSGRVLAVLAEAWMLTDESGLVFPNAKGRQLTRGALGRVLRRREPATRLSDADLPIRSWALSSPAGEGSEGRCRVTSRFEYSYSAPVRRQADGRATAG